MKKLNKGIIKTPLGVLLAIGYLFLAACGQNHTPRATATPWVEVVGVLASPTPSPTQTPTPTPLPSPTGEPTPRRVTVSRINETVDPLQNRLLKIGQFVPTITFTDIDGNSYALHEMKGRAILLNFWTVGCGSCFYEFPLFQEIRDQIPEEDLLILAVNVSELAQETRTLAETLGITYPMVVDPQGEIFARYFGGAVVPTTYFIGIDNTVFDVVIGPLDADLLRAKLEAMGFFADRPV